jgi:hypothetical protein
MINEVCLVYYSDATTGIFVPQVAAVTTGMAAAKDWADYNRKVRGANPIIWDETDDRLNTVTGLATCDDDDDQVFYYYTIATWPVQ